MIAQKETSKRPAVGTMRDRVTVQVLARVSDGQGGFLQPSWTAGLSIWAEVIPMSASQVNFSEQLQKRVTHKVYIRRDDYPNLVLENRLVFGTRPFKIKGIRNVGELDRIIEISAEEGVHP